MKKILFSLVALVASMSMNAQQIKLMKGNTVVATYSAAQVDNVVFEEAQGSTTNGTATTGIGNVGWVQLWENGPKFAEFNVGVTDGKAESFGGYYCWGGSIDKDTGRAYKSGNVALTGNADTATNLWGSAWRMPTKDELDALNDNCVVTWTNSYNESGVKGRIYTGKGDYASNSIFLPAAGCFEDGEVRNLDMCFYWSSTPSGSSYAYRMRFDQYTYGAGWYDDSRSIGYSVRAVLAE